MAHTENARPELDPVRTYLHGVAKHLVDRLYGPKGPVWGTRLTEIEDVFMALREVLTEDMLQQALQRQAAQHAEQPAAYHACPGCDQRTKTKSCDDEPPKPRAVQTRVGEAQWHEPHQYCTRCRRAFFPSTQEPGH
jgi:hypothetical protein